MAIIGFVVICLFALYLLIVGLGGLYVGLAFGTSEGFLGLVPVVLSILVFKYALSVAPFHFVMN